MTDNICRLCFDSEQTPDNPLISPCKCRGSIEYIHKNCTINWIARAHNSQNGKLFYLKCSSCTETIFCEIITPIENEELPIIFIILICIYSYIILIMYIPALKYIFPNQRIYDISLGLFYAFCIDIIAFISITLHINRRFMYFKRLPLFKITVCGILYTFLLSLFHNYAILFMIYTVLFHIWICRLHRTVCRSLNADIEWLID